MARDLQKPVVIELVFQRRLDPRTRAFTGPSIVTMNDLSNAITATNTMHPGRWNKPLQPHNPANFFKDIIRSRNRNQQWPSSVLSAGYTGIEAFGSGAVFEFVAVPVGQNAAFAASNFPTPTSTTPRYDLQSVSLPMASRRLGRRDEPWLMQVAVKLHIIETHLALYSPLLNIQQVDHLQMNLKLRRSEVDGVYLAIQDDGATLTEIIVTCEAKGRSDDILPDQILRQVTSTFALPTVSQTRCIPMALKIVGPSEVYVVEFDVVDQMNLVSLSSLTIASEAVYVLRPLVPGIAD